MNDLAGTHNLTYTRYSDDLTFSASSLNRNQATAFIRRATGTIARHGHELHHKKTRVVPPGARKIILGLLLTDQGIRLSPEHKRRTEWHIRGVTKFGLTAHVGFAGFNSIFSFVDHMDGRIAYSMDIEPSVALAFKSHWEEALIESGFDRA